MEQSVWIYIILGIIGLTLPWLTTLEKYKPLNIPMVALLLGMLVFSLPIDLPTPDPIKHGNVILKLSELSVIISLMGVGLKIDRPFSIKNFRVPLLLATLTMVGCIAATAGLGWWLGLAPASALLLGAVFAPTDPVIANDIQVEFDENEAEEHHVKFSLTAEAGINDGTAFPFTWLAIWAAAEGFSSTGWLGTWLLQDLVYRIAAGLAIGYGMGRLIAWLFFTLPQKVKYPPKQLGFLAIAVTMLVYGLTEVFSGYGFIAVFVAALTIRHYERAHSFQKEMHDVVFQVEQFFITILLLLLGGYFVDFWFQSLTWPVVVLVLTFLLVIRPVFGLLSTFSQKMNWKHRWIIAFMGIKGVGSFFYLAFALHETSFIDARLLWATVAFLVVVSIFLHGITGFFVKRKLLGNDE